MQINKELSFLRILVFAFVLLYANAGFSQPMVIESMVDWSAFSASNTENQDNFICYEVKSCPNGFTIQKADILKYESIPLTEIELANFSALPYDTAINIKTWVQTTQKKSELALSFYPLVFNKSKNQVERITYLKVEVKGTVNALKSAPVAKLGLDSKLSNGNWFKIKLKQTGIYKLTYEQLLGIGISKPDDVRLYNRGGDILPYVNQNELESDLLETPIFMEKGMDGVFNAGDYILFYAEGPITWHYNYANGLYQHELHPYTDAIYLFLTSDFGAGQRLETVATVNQVPQYTSSSFDSYQCYEKEVKNLIRSGRIFYDQQMRSGDDLSVQFNFPNLILSEPIKVHSAIAVHTPDDASTCYFTYSLGNTVLYQVPIGSTIAHYVYGTRFVNDFDFNATSGNITMDLNFSGGNSVSEGYLDFICLNARETLKIGSSGQFSFRDKLTLDYDIVKYSIDNQGKNLFVWDITNPLSPKMVSLNQNSENTSFNALVDTLHDYIAFDGTKFLTPETQGSDLGMVKNQNLHGISGYDMVIVTHPEFLEQANDLAKFHQDNDTLTVFVTTPTEIYNEFSSGTPDVSAIRNFMRYLYDKGGIEGSQLPRYLLLFGDGSYENRPNISGNSNFILTYQNSESMVETTSFVTDDYFGILDAGENVVTGTLDIGVGRFPVQTDEEAWLVINKIKHYYTPASQGSWRSQICLIGDNGDGDMHMQQADGICKKVEREHPEYNLNKILFDAFPKESTPAGDRFPQVTSAIYDQMQQGALIIDYIGHGNPRILAHEEVIHIEDVLNWKNYDKLSVFVTASCEVGRFDDYARISMGEWMLLSPLGAGIAAFTTTRVVYADSNYELNKDFFDYVLNPNYRLGDVIQRAKNQTGGTNMRNFSLLGDPALKLMIPQNSVVVSSINNQPVRPEPQMIRNSNDNVAMDASNTFGANMEVTIEAADTINALSVANVNGYIVDKEGNVIFRDGTVYPIVYDKRIPLMVLDEDTGSPDTVLIQNSVLYKGKASITQGFFNFSFMVPKDINYKTGLGKISLYAVVDSMQALGYSTGFYIGGSNDSAKPDFAGPDITLYMNDTLFKNGGTTNDNPLLLAFLTDESGINTTGNGIGHNISAVLDDKNESPILLNGYYESDLNQYNKGKVAFPMSGLEKGPHSLLFKVWDVYNNSSEESIDFTVYDGNELVINHLFNYPNPMGDETRFTLEHNQADETMNVTIRIYDITGNKVSEIRRSIENAGFKIPDIQWDGTNTGGSLLPNGFYLYKVELETSEGLKNSSSSKLMIFR